LPRYESFDKPLNFTEDSSFVVFTGLYPRVNPGDTKIITPQITTKGLDAGIYNIVFRMNYVNDEDEQVFESLVPIGIYDINPSINVNSQVSSDVDFVVSPSLEIITPHINRFNIFTTAFKISDITSPSNPNEITSAIKDIIEKTFPAYLENSSLVYEKEAWLNSHLSSASKGEARLIWSAILENLGRVAGIELGSEITKDVFIKLLENGEVNPAAMMESASLALDAGACYGDIVFSNLFSDNICTLV
jgi:hypothetical protein